MKYNPLGTSGLSVSDLCLGTMTWGSQNSETDAHQQMDMAVERGINFFDTAELYPVPPNAETQGRTEDYIGTWFQKSGKRNSVILATKMSGKGLPWIRQGAKITALDVAGAVEGSLKRLKTDRIDLYQLHWPNRPFPHFSNHWSGMLDFTTTDTTTEEHEFVEILNALQEQIKQGEIRFIGLSNDTAWGLMSYVRLSEKYNLPRIVSVQNEFSLMQRHDDPFVAEVCVRENIAYLPWSPLSSGMLSGKYANGARPIGSRWHFDSRKSARDTPRSHNVVDKYLAVAKKHGLDSCQMALAFCRQQNFVTSTIIGATSLMQLQNNIDACDLTLSLECLKDIDTVYREHPMPF